MTTTTTNMSLVLPDVSVTVGPTYATLLNAAYTLIDSHDHSTGKGVAITPSGINISSDLTFGQNNATNLRTARLYNNSSLSLGVNDKTCLYAINNELHYVDGAGNDITITSGGAINIASVTAISVKDSLFILQYFGDTTRQARFSAANVPSGTTRIYTLPTVSGNDTLASLTATQTLTATTLTNGIITGCTAVNLISGAGTLTLPTSGTITIPGATDTVALLAASQTLTNKILTGNTIASFTPNGGTNTLTAPAITDTLVTKTSTDILSNKTLATPIVSTTANFTEISTPANPSAGTLKIYAKSDDNFYSLNSSGLEQQIGAGGSGGAINYISNNGFENGTVTGWATYSGGTTTPTNGTGGSPSSTFAINSSSPLRGTYDGLWTKSANNRQGEGFSYAFTLSTADLGKTLQITFDSIASTNMVSGDMTIYVYDVTNSVLITPSSINVPTGTSSQYSVCFQATTGTSYRLIFHTSTTSALAYTLHVDGMSISPIVRPIVAGESDWIAYTPTFSAGFGTVTNASGYWRRVGDTVHVIGSCTTGTVAGSVASISLPTVVTSINTSKLSISANTTSNAGNDVGAFSTGLANASCAIVTAPGTSTAVVYVGGLANGTAQLVPANGSTIAANTTVCSFNFQVPATNWSSNITLASSTPAIEYVYNTTTSDAADTTAFGYGASGGLVPGALTAARLKRVRFQNPIQPTDRIVVEVRAGTTGIWMPVSATDSGFIASPLQYQNAVAYGLGYQTTFISSTDLDICFGQYKYPSGATYGASGAAWAGTNYYRVAKYSSVGISELAPASSTSAGTITREAVWTSWTPTFGAGFGTVSNNTSFYKVLGDSLIIRGSFTSGTVTTSVGSITLPSGFTLSSAKLSLANTTSAAGTMIGTYGADGGGGTGFGFMVSATGTSTVLVYFAIRTQTGGTFLHPELSVSTNLVTGAVFSYSFEVPIV